MKSLITYKVVDNKREYPYLGVDDYGPPWRGKFIVLFTNRNTGVVVYNENLQNYAWDLGYTSATWNESDFKIHNGEVILSND